MEELRRSSHLAVGRDLQSLQPQLGTTSIIRAHSQLLTSGSSDARALRMPITSFRDLEVWQCSMELAKCVYRATGTMPFPHRTEIGAQMRKAGVSTPSNVAEGFRQGALGAYLRHVRIAAGSTAELETQAELAADLGLWTPHAGAEVRHLAERSGQMLTGLIRALEQKADKDPNWRRFRP